ncbi:MBL fold metallo-hydrolase [Pseudomonas sp. RU47]|uniref:MBL fold metallo-hydrolase n=2 Tax=Pseudomonas TaxID=286 RepID=UPI000FDD4EE4|nr:MBL fold metallo-hydrolase [Pseudomonas sp. RU47]AZZ77730.1 MBL fold metallo-hydrolase [Pseudomonas sp. RU47]QXZ17471.1 MBL fold metallo-hydrolase [Pseudomonas sp. AO-1]
MKTILRIATALSLAALSCGASAATTSCDTSHSMSIQLLGSGGPISDDARASSGEIVWIDGKSRLLIDAGGGTYLRFGQAHARLEDLNFIGISHFHTDHSVDLPAILKGAYFMASGHTTALVGPDGSDSFPSMTEFFHDTFAAKTGSFAYLEGLHDGSDGLNLKISPIINVDRHAEKASLVYQDAEVKVYAYGIPHGDVPTLAFRIEGKCGTIVISADQNGSRAGFVDFAKGADILVMPAAIDDDADDTSKFLHATPTVVGKIAAAVNPKMLILNHFMGKSLKNKDSNVEIIKRYYHGPVYAGRDLSRFEMP